MKLRYGRPEEADMSPQRVALIARLAEGWVRDAIHPALVVLVARRGVIVLHEASREEGRFGQGPDSPPLSCDVIFPMASLTKPITVAAIETPTFGGTCNVSTGQGCTRIPKTDDGGAPAAFYPFFSTQRYGEQCVWALGNVNPGVTTNDFGKNSQFRDLLFLTFLVTGGHGATVQETDDYRQVLSTNPCTAESEGDNDQDGGDQE